MHTIAILSQKGGAGKTTLALHLAVEAEAYGLSAVVFDLDPQASACTWGGRRAAETPQVFPAHAPMLSTLLAQVKRQGVDLVVLDGAPNADAATLAAAKVADIILIPCRPTAMDLAAMTATLSIATIANTPAWIVLNAVHHLGHQEKEARAAFTKEGVQVAPQALHQLAAFSNPIGTGQVAREWHEASRAADETEQVFQWLARTLGYAILIPTSDNFPASSTHG